MFLFERTKILKTKNLPKKIRFRLYFLFSTFILRFYIFIFYDLVLFPKIGFYFSNISSNSFSDLRSSDFKRT
ncbi:hypothetical protein LEP1GSC116_1910 [Leptospira interrogans serovar Icterohaemorrhagiae str. Verdun HP]|uniref:Uncharacterized protein n=1 Tax=Leptospira interrogans serovar Icterohaemorrhagiae str. Verdun HP TaxID=1049910 RepID=M6RJR6_LEPIR|nr:hypothetical protein LEP1GSC116_1910 [Leptospira interrogans serovar Icterohaemorrhagiae str. Verdun HP]